MLSLVLRMDVGLVADSREYHDREEKADEENADAIVHAWYAFNKLKRLCRGVNTEEHQKADSDGQ